jgi:hypothetical protein
LRTKNNCLYQQKEESQAKINLILQKVWKSSFPYLGSELSHQRQIQAWFLSKDAIFFLKNKRLLLDGLRRLLSHQYFCNILKGDL